MRITESNDTTFANNFFPFVIPDCVAALLHNFDCFVDYVIFQSISRQKHSVSSNFTTAMAAFGFTCKVVIVAASFDAAAARTCDSVCQAAGGVWGHIIGTAPSCAADCDHDCKGSLFCNVVNSGDGFDDYGHGCASGDKICCCIGHANTSDYQLHSDHKLNSFALESGVAV